MMEDYLRQEFNLEIFFLGLRDCDTFEISVDLSLGIA